jgi:hypothetical protein
MTVRKVLCSLVFVLFGCGNAYAMPMSYVTDEVLFVNTYENAAYEASFGLYAIGDHAKRYQVFAYDQEPGTFSFVSADIWPYLSSGFGWYFEIHTGGLSDNTAEYRWFDDAQYNQYGDGTSVDTTIDHIFSFVTEHFIIAKLDDQLGGGDRDFNDMKIMGYAPHGIQITSAAPVPEPTTMLLFGAGLVGLAAVGRRKKE